MKTLIVYGSKHGATEKCVNVLKERLTNVEVVNLKNSLTIDLKNYDTIVIGSGVYMGMVLKEVRKFISQYMEELKTKRTGLFICSMREGNEAIEELRTNFGDLFELSVAKDYFGGEFDFTKMSFLERFIVKMVMKSEKKTINLKELYTTLSVERITQFAEKINNQETI